jgi:hypothetical protein
MAGHVHMALMEQEFRRPEYTPRKHNRASSTMNCLLAAVGITAMTFCLVGAAAVTTVWAVSKLMGLSDTALLVGAALIAIPVIWATIWTAGRAWHLERRLAAGQDVDTPVYALLHYFKRSA